MTGVEITSSTVINV